MGVRYIGEVQRCRKWTQTGNPEFAEVLLLDEFIATEMVTPDFLLIAEIVSLKSISINRGSVTESLDYFESVGLEECCAFHARGRVLEIITYPCRFSV